MKFKVGQIVKIKTNPMMSWEVVRYRYGETNPYHLVEHDGGNGTGEAWVKEEELECVHQWNVKIEFALYKPTTLRCMQCGKEVLAESVMKEAAEKMDWKPPVKPEIKVGQVWKYNEDAPNRVTKGEEFVIEEVLGNSVDYRYSDGKCGCMDYEFIIENATLVEDVLTFTDETERIESDPDGCLGDENPWGINFWIDYNFKIEREKMEKPKNEIEKDALKDAKAAVKDKIRTAKAKEYESALNEFISTEKAARIHRKDADEMYKALCLTDKDMKEFFGEDK